MSVTLRIVVAALSVFTTLYVCVKMKKSQFVLEDTLFWIILSAVLLFFSAFPQFAFDLGKKIGFDSPGNFVFIGVIFLLLIKIFLMNLRISKLENRISEIIRKHSIIVHELNLPEELDEKED